MRNSVFNVYARIFQFVLKYGACCMPWSTAKIVSGENIYQDLSDILSENKHHHILIITDQHLMSLNLLDPLLNMLNTSNISYYIYNETVANPTINNVQKATSLYRQNNCDGIIAFGGGSPIDCAKAVGACIVRPKKPIHKMKGLLKVRRRLPIVYAVPTTAGTGSETTIAAVITDEATHEKYAINDICLIPKYAILDTNLTLNLPPHLTSTTGMDALAHAVEAYISRSATKQTRMDALYAIKLIHENLFEAYLHGNNFNARAQMQLASFYAGKSFTRAYVGNIHAIAHTLGGAYSIPHGLAVSVVFPVVLRYYGTSVEKDLACLADHIGITDGEDTQAVKSEKFICWIEKMNTEMKIPKAFSEIKMEDIGFMLEKAYREANPLYPVPMIFSRKDFEQNYLSIMTP